MDEARFFGRSRKSVADTNKERPVTARPPCKLPVRWPIIPTMNGPTNPPRLATERINAIPTAAANPVRNSLGRE